MLWKQPLRAGLLILVIIGCAQEKSSMVNQAGIFTTYSLSYDDSDQTLYACAIFNFGGSTGTYLRLDGSSSVTLDGETLAEETTIANQVQYEVKKDKVILDEVWKPHTFAYKNNDGRVFYNSIELPQQLTASYPNTTVEISSSFITNWESIDAIGSDLVYVSLTKASGAKGISEYAEGDLSNVTSGTIALSSAHLTSLGTGVHFAQVCRKHISIPQQAPEEGGIFKSTSCSKKTMITVEN